MIPLLISHAIRAASTRTDVLLALRTLYQELDARIEALPGACSNRGLCCHFDSYGHRLYVTTLEAAYYLSFQEPAPIAGRSCPHARNGRCQVRSHRPMGCRIFFCDPRAQDWQGPLTEEFLVRLRRLHEAFDAPYHYGEWLSVLTALGGTASENHGTNAESPTTRYGVGLPILPTGAPAPGP